MACRDEGQSAAQASMDREAAKEKIDKLTRMLCAVLTKFSLARMTNDEVAEWWQEHLQTDRLAARTRAGREGEGRARQDRSHRRARSGAGAAQDVVVKTSDRKRVITKVEKCR